MTFLKMLLLPFFLFTLAACDTGNTIDPPPEPAVEWAEGTFTALLNGEAYSAETELYIGQDVVVLDATKEGGGYYHQSIGLGQRNATMTEGTSFELRCLTCAERDGGVSNTLTAYESDGDAVIMGFGLLESEPREFVVEEVDEAANYYRARFNATLVANEPGFAGSEFRQWPDTLRFTEGVFEGQLRPDEE